MKKIKNLPFGTKITLLTCGFMVIPALIITTLLLTIAGNQLLTNSNDAVKRITTDLFKLAKVQNDLLVTKLESDLNVAHQISSTYGKLTLSKDVQVPFKAVDQVTKNATDITLPQMKFGDQLVQNDFTIVDKIQQIVGGTCTVFQKMPGDHFLRVSTNVKKLDGERAVGTYIPSSSPVAKSLTSNKLFKGKAFVVNKDYITAYDPLTDSSGEVVGALYVGVPLMTQALQDNVAEATIGTTGFAYCFNSEGRVLIHPKYAGETKKDADFVSSVLNRGDKEGLLEYTDTTTKETVIVSYKYFEDWDWYICTTVHKDEILASIKAIRTLAVTVTLILLALGTVLTLLFARGITRTLKRITDRAEKISNGDLTTANLSLDSEDEIGYLARVFDNLNDSLRAIVQQIIHSTTGLNTTVQVINTASEEMVSSTADLADSAQRTGKSVELITQSINEVRESISSQTASVNQTSAASEEMSKNITQVLGNVEAQAASINESSAAVNQMATSIKQIAENAARVNDISHKTRAKADASCSTAGNAVSGMKDIASSSEQIKNIITVITNIASQTNLLALNAAIEAARAGEAGRGFAVVADEVRSLAEQSAQAAKEITELINRANEKAEMGVDLVESVNKAIIEMSKSISEVGTLIEEVSNSTNEQEIGAREIAESMDKLNEITQEILVATNEQSLSAQEISKSMQDLMRISEGINNAMETQAETTSEVNEAVEVVSSITETNRNSVQEFVQCTSALTDESESLDSVVKKFRL
ncbi:MAG: methyl-accepting chemotaxis protein [Candidatus Auribacter fodinae]|jgi:methyl-accepting chemotaxis protein|uniref:Methyl-accepting chemotaxis protein n=1 Tax=Candidatus Auribacter fodinae TaxID=2093366 RepID=A0A3A4R8P7_9BACT|nr:MAG: methyl-accepting chemotaxis protein [Candidatus Auribacter fodinae]